MIKQMLYARGDQHGPFAGAHYYSDWETAQEAARDDGTRVWEVTATIDPAEAQPFDET